MHDFVLVAIGAALAVINGLILFFLSAVETRIAKVEERLLSASQHMSAIGAQITMLECIRTTRCEVEKS